MSHGDLESTNKPVLSWISIIILVTFAVLEILRELHIISAGTGFSPFFWSAVLCGLLTCVYDIIEHYQNRSLKPIIKFGGMLAALAIVFVIWVVLGRSFP